MRSRGIREPLREDLLAATGRIAKESPRSQPHQHRDAIPWQVGQFPLIVAVSATGRLVAKGADRLVTGRANDQDNGILKFELDIEYEQKWPREFSNAGRFASVKELVEEAKREGRDKRYSWKEHTVLEGPKGNRIYRAYKKRRSLSLKNKPEMFPFPVVSVPGALSRLLHFRRVQKARAAIAKELGINLGHAEAGASVFKFDYWDHYRDYDPFIRETLIESDNGLRNFVSNFEGLTSYHGGPSVSGEVKGYAQQQLKGSPMWRAIYKQFLAPRWSLQNRPCVDVSKPAM
jgi:hypothetical protein